MFPYFSSLLTHSRWFPTLLAFICFDACSYFSLSVSFDILQLFLCFFPSPLSPGAFSWVVSQLFFLQVGTELSSPSSPQLTLSSSVLQGVLRQTVFGHLSQDWAVSPLCNLMYPETAVISCFFPPLNIFFSYKIKCSWIVFIVLESSLLALDLFYDLDSRSAENLNLAVFSCGSFTWDLVSFFTKRQWIKKTIYIIFNFFFLSLYWVCYNIASVLCFGFLAISHVGC